MRRVLKALSCIGTCVVEGEDVVWYSHVVIMIVIMNVITIVNNFNHGHSVLILSKILNLTLIL